MRSLSLESLCGGIRCACHLLMIDLSFLFFLIPLYYNEIIWKSLFQISLRPKLESWLNDWASLTLSPVDCRATSEAVIAAVRLSVGPNPILLHQLGKPQPMNNFLQHFSANESIYIMSNFSQNLQTWKFDVKKSLITSERSKFRKDKNHFYSTVKRKVEYCITFWNMDYVNLHFSLAP